MNPNLKSNGGIIMKKIAILIADIFEENELYYPYYRLLEEGYDVHLVGAKQNETYKGKHGNHAKSSIAARDISADDYEAVVIPGGYSPDYMRRDKATVQFVKDMFKQDKPIASICHGPWMMASACDLKGRTITGAPSIKDDLENAGAIYVDREVVVDGTLITSRNPGDLPAFAKAIIKALK